MKWKNWPTWLKGGVIALSLYIFITLILIPFGFPKGGWFPYWFLPSLFGYFPWGSLVNSIERQDLMDELFFIIPSITYFLIGALIGFIYGKIKQKKV